MKKIYLCISLFIFISLPSQLLSQENSWDKKGEEFVKLLNVEDFEKAVSLMSEIMNNG